MALEKWIGGTGVGLTWSNLFNNAADLTSLANGNAIQSSTTVNNGTALDVFADLSLALGSLTTGSGAPYIGFYLYPLNQDASTYGDGRFGSAAAGPPPSQYFIGSVPLIASVTQAQAGVVRGFVLPPGAFTLVAYNLAGAALPSSSNVVKYRTFNRSLV